MVVGKATSKTCVTLYKVINMGLGRTFAYVIVAYKSLSHVTYVAVKFSIC